MAKGQEVEQVANENGKELLNTDGSVTKLIEWATERALTPEQMMDLFLESGVGVSHGEEITGDYVLVHSEEKPRWCDKHCGERLFVVKWEFYDGQGEREFTSMHLVSNAGKFILNDSAQGGMYGQLKQITKRREENDPQAASKRTSKAGLMVVRGLRRNKPFMFNTDTKTAIPRNELEDFEKHPANKREESRQTWSFDL